MSENLFVIFLLSLVQFNSGLKPPEISVEDVEVHPYEYGKFVEMKEGETLVMRCAGRYEMKFNFPDLKDNKGYDEADFNARAEEAPDPFLADENVLTLKNLKTSDTGAYGCSSADHESVNNTIYVFVKGDSVFVPLVPTGFSYNSGEMEVPCRTSSYVDRQLIQLYGNGELVKDAWKNYRHDEGFKLTKKMLTMKPITQTPFECRYTGTPSESVSILITENNQNDSADNYLLSWDEPMKWPYVGYNYSLSCAMTFNSTEQFTYYHNNLKVTCPRCEHKVTQHRVKNVILATIQLESLTPDDAGNYTCTWTNDKFEEKKEITKVIEIAPKEGQIKVLQRSAPLIKIMQGQPITLWAKLAVHPQVSELYSAKWIRKYNSPGKEGEDQNEPLINDENLSIVNTVTNFEFEEKLSINGVVMNTNMSGTYILSVVHSGTVENIEWQVAVQNPEPETRISIREPSTFVVFEQPFYRPNTHFHIDCMSISIPPAETIMQSRRLNSNDNFVDVSYEDLKNVSGTFESGFIWNKTIDGDIEIKCQATRSDGKTTSVTKEIRIADKEPTSGHIIKKSSKATTLETQKEIYEGDGVKLNCTVPHATTWTVNWMFNDVNLPTTTEIDGHTKIFYAMLENVNPSNDGTYTCLVTNGNQEKRLIQSIKVESVSKPYHTQSDPEKPIVLEYGEKATLNCHLLGKPKPTIEWYKDGHIYTHGETVNSSLDISRVRAEDEGEFICRATNRAGITEQKIKVNVKGSPESHSRFVISFLSILSFLVLCGLLAFCVLWLIQRKKSYRQSEALAQLYEHFMQTTGQPPTETTSKLPIDQRIYQLPYRTEYEVNRENVELGKMLGHGNFGVVYEGWMKKRSVTNEAQTSSRLTVAVKAPRNGYDVNQQTMLAEELKVMCAIGKHPNILSLIGAVTKNMRNGELYVIVEMCELGNLRDYLLKNRANFVNELKTAQPNNNDDAYLQPISSQRTRYAAETDPNWESQRLLEEANTTTISTSDLISFSMQIANGMEYLSQVPCVHRDLAARNVLLTSNKIVRVADFGMARKHEDKSYYRIKKTKELALPYKWMSIEAIQENKYTQESDVWAFGITLYEIFSLGGNPYPLTQHIDLLDFLLAGNRNSKPQYCHEDIYELMKKCWEADPLNRPSFSNCVYFLKEHITKASPQLLERLERDLIHEVEKQERLDSWLDEEDSDPRILAQTGQSPSPTNSEGHYVQDFPRNV